jgi:hypothetical protein
MYLKNITGTVITYLFNQAFIQKGLSLSTVNIYYFITYIKLFLFLFLRLNVPLFLQRMLTVRNRYHVNIKPKVFTPHYSKHLNSLNLYKGYAIAQLVKALRYKPEGPGFDSRWCHWNFSLT